jgi:hypothetical protein
MALIDGMLQELEQETRRPAECSGVFLKIN